MAPCRILYLSTVQPSARRTGGEICTMNFVEALKQAGAHVDVVAYQRPESEALLPDGFFSPRRLTIESAASPMQSAVWLGAAVARRRPFSVQKFVTRAMRDAVVKRLAETAYDVVVVDHAQMSWLLDLVPTGMRTVLVAHNVEHVLYARNAAELRRKPGRFSRLKSAVFKRESDLMEVAEQRAVDRCTELWTLSSDDAASFATMAGGGSAGSAIRVFAVPGQTFSPTPGVGSNGARSIDVGLLGSWIWDINRDGLNWFLGKVAPLLTDLGTIAVAGRSDRPAGTREGNVRFVGFVPDAGEFLRDCKVVVIPSTIGSGIQIKTIETIGLGVPIVSTPIGLRGIADRPAYVEEAADASAMAAAIRRQLAKPAMIEAEGHAWWTARRERFEADVAQALAGVLAARPPRPVTA